jgi:hypothetical protein
MYVGNCVTDAYLNGVEEFLKAAEKYVDFTKDPWILCPCCDCRNIVSDKRTTVIQTHLIKRGFAKGYEIWSHHGEVEERTNDQESDAYEE